ncbi:hypothetical protein DN826_21405 [Stutzerimonas nosocomialis]|uniref:DUF2511 domain-containing protein n=1 Tax=Stutzerimonas nosocomialis TaxID=1056496 RepID=UPI001108E323|nr:DUF2511 domain-containing protein [Stutzerimonas nosocomialis]TLX52869.1 hypothetical protein DN826_21405 [Stutzerimonas nosocomialis]
MRKLLLGLLLASPLALAAPPKLISAEEFGSDWPFTTEEMHLQCLPGNAVVVTDPETGRMYGVNGAASGRAKQLALAPLEQVWRESESIPGTKVQVTTVLEQGISLCKDQ